MSEHDISAEVEELRQQRDQARTEFDSLGPVIEGLEKARSHIRADNKRLFQRVREEEALAAKWQQRAEAAEAEAAKLHVKCECLAHDCQELEDSREYNAGLVVERDVELAMLREALDTIPLHEYGDARREGCDAKGAWDCFKEALAEHISAVRSAPAVYDAKNDIAALRERLATAEDETTRLCKELTIASSLVPSADWLLMVAVAQDYFKPGCYKHCPLADEAGECGLEYDDIGDWARNLAARIRAWRGDGDEEEESDGD